MRSKLILFAVTAIVLNLSGTLASASIADAVKQSNKFASTGEVSEPLLDGFQHQGFKTVFAGNGNCARFQPGSTLVHRKNDAILSATIAQWKSKLQNTSSLQKARELTQFSNSALHPQNLTAQELSDWDDSFTGSRRGKKIPLGQFVQLKHGVCAQQALLLKVLADELGIPCKLHFGYFKGNGHLWTTMTIDGRTLLFDPAQKVFEGSADFSHYKTIAQLYGPEFVSLPEVLRQINDSSKDPAARERALLRLYEMDKKALGPTHPHCLVTMQQLAEMYSQQGEYSRSQYLLQRVSKLTADHYGPRHPETASALHSEARAAQKAGQAATAERLYKSCLTLSKQCALPSIDLADVHYNLGRLYLSQRRLKQAQAQFQSAKRLYRSAGRRDDARDAANMLAQASRRSEQPRSEMKTTSK